MARFKIMDCRRSVVVTTALSALVVGAGVVGATSAGATGTNCITKASVKECVDNAGLYPVGLTSNNSVTPLVGHDNFDTYSSEANCDADSGNMLVYSTGDFVVAVGSQNVAGPGEGVTDPGYYRVKYDDTDTDVKYTSGCFYFDGG